MTAAPDAANETETITRSRVESSLTKPDTDNDSEDDVHNDDEDNDTGMDNIERVDTKDRYFLKSSSEEDLLNGSGYDIVNMKLNLVYCLLQLGKPMITMFCQET